MRERSDRNVRPTWFVPNSGCRSLLFFFFCFGLFGRRFASLLGLGFFHRLLGFFGLFGTDFGTLLAFFVEDLLAAEEFDEGLVSGVALAPSCADDARVSAVAIAEARADGVKKLLHGFVSHEIGRAHV